jgi:outer membrane protein OmpA-like peptidoglycan-associated protein
VSRVATKFVVLALATVALIAASPLAAGASTIGQGPPTLGTTDVAGSASYTDFLAATSGFTGTVTFTTSIPDFTIIGANELATTAALSALDSPYTITGSDSDGSGGDIGTWSYSLTVTADAILQGAPTAGSTNAAGSTAFNATLAASAGFVGPVSFTTSTPDFTIVNGDELETTSALSASGSPYTVTGSDLDAYGDVGSWSYVLTVAPSGTPPPAPTPPPTPSTLIQSSPKTGTTSTASSATFTSGPISVSGGTGPVTFVTTSSSPSLIVSSSGLISTTGPLDAGTYSTSGTDTDTHGDAGTWSYALTVTAVSSATYATVTFLANGGRGTMSSEEANGPAALTLNDFVRKGFTFVGWNTLANGSGVSYANGGLYPFSTSGTLFARWKKGKAPDRTLTFLANGGKGAMRSEIENAPTVISADRFHRAGYTFLDWNTKPNGSGQRLAPGTTYPFTKSLILYAQWKKITKAPTKKPTKKPTKAPKKPSQEVTFAANGGTGSMTPERHDGPAVLTPNDFRRSGYTFAQWNTRPNGSGSTYTNGARYSFDASVTLYAEWKKVTPTAPTFSVPGGVTIGEFARGSSSLSSGLKSQIQNLARKIKTKSDTQVTLYGFGDEAASANAADLALGRHRSESVATYLEARLAAIGLKGFTISIAPESPSANEVGTVVAALS